MLYPSIDALIGKVESKYYLVTVVATRARELQTGAKRLSKVKTNKNITVALNEIIEDQINFSKSDTVRAQGLAIPERRRSAS